ncbi:Bis(5'-nucleosyl)-tetraphosphatase PrpE [asymmetrical] [Mycolicibacterium vanbaalenii]|uniref:Bis(5'-nucleosyl)-tetraphosphatase PrpE [asymmetrical] n=1 Tax=Mycolicibacterium vanbaalenii TaxID=110539 RepID=A0A5S9RD41_MYCVN|nr:Bis(5'-nucleosyl)-tetraphosphatase PrpE [asymmetrical] [Mycolicibacterium vanbaalenii]
MATIIQYWDYDPETPTTCPPCGWTGPTRGLYEQYAEFFDITCPTCSTMLLIVMFPTLTETEAAAAAGNRLAQQELPGIEAQDRAQRERARHVNDTVLRPTSVLPDLDGEQLVIDWDFEEHGDELWTVLRHNDIEIWREFAFWEGIDRFPEVVKILQARYGARLVELRPTPASTLWLWGDKLSAPDKVDAINASLQQAAEMSTSRSHSVTCDVPQCDDRSMQGYDIIGDIHGCAPKLETLLADLGYQPDPSTGAYRHPHRTVIFVGDLIDRGDEQLRVLQIAKAMVDAGTAQVVMGNHEFNAIAYATENPAGSGNYLRPRTAKNTNQHRAFLEQLTDAQRAHNVDWFTTLPLWLDLDGLRVVHACWHPESIDIVQNELGGNRFTSQDQLIRATTDGEPLYHAIEVLLKGPEISLAAHGQPAYRDKDGHVRKRARIRWWNDTASSLREIALLEGNFTTEDGAPYHPRCRIPPPRRSCGPTSTTGRSRSSSATTGAAVNPAIWSTGQHALRAWTSAPSSRAH